MGGLCSKEGVVEELTPPTPKPPPRGERLQKAPSQSLKQLITVTADAAVVAPVVHAVITRAESNAKAKARAAAQNVPAAGTAPEESVPAPGPVYVVASLNKSYSTAGRPYRRKIAETFRDFSPTALALLDTLLAIEPSHRGTAAAALDNDFFRTKPLACDPASLPKYPPSKEYDARLRGMEATRYAVRGAVELASNGVVLDFFLVLTSMGCAYGDRQNTTAIGGKGSMSVKPGRNESKAAPAQDAAIGGDNQRRQAAAAAASRGVNPKSASHHYSSLEDSVPGFRMEPPASTLQTGGFGSTWYRKDAGGDPRAAARPASSVRVSNRGGAQLTSQRSYAQSRGTDLHPSSSAARHANSRYNRLDVAEPANALDRPCSTLKKDLVARDAPAAGYGGRNKRIHYSGPLVPPGGNMEEMLREHERQIQQAVRKARVDKERTNNSSNMHYY
ncbi:hypothetical protein ABZP36_023505 [Zizania latifolia]